MKKNISLIVPFMILSLSSCGSVTAKETFSLTQWNIYLGNGNAENIKKALKDISADIIFLEECSEVAYSAAITDYVIENEQYVLSERYLQTGECCYVPILFNKNKFNYIESGAYKFTDGSSVSISKAYNYLILENDDLYYCFINFHGSVCRNKYVGFESYTQEEIDEIANLWRVSNTNEVLAKSKELSAIYGEKLKIIVGGDCNFNLESEPYQIISENGFYDSEFASEFKEKNTLKTSRSWTTDKFQEGLSIDHIFANKNVAFKSQKYIRNEDVIKGSDHALNSLEIYL